MPVLNNQRLAQNSKVPKFPDGMPIKAHYVPNLNHTYPNKSPEGFHFPSQESLLLWDLPLDLATQLLLHDLSALVHLLGSLYVLPKVGLDLVRGSLF